MELNINTTKIEENLKINQQRGFLELYQRQYKVGVFVLVPSGQNY